MAKASPKRRITEPEPAAFERVGETPNALQASAKRRTGPNRRRNDESTTPEGLNTPAEQGSQAANVLIGEVIPAESATRHQGSQKASPKHRTDPKRRRNDEDSTGVGETTNPGNASDARDEVSERRRNDESGDLFGADPMGFPAYAAGEGAASAPEAAMVSAKGARTTAASPKASAKHRTVPERRRNDEDVQSVGETTNPDEASAKRRSAPLRRRNDESDVTNPPPRRSRAKAAPLNPDYNLDDELFICDVLDAIPKDDIPSMEHPIFTLATQPDMREIHYEHNGTVVDIWPSRLGLATIHDKDILIYCISQLIAKKNKGEPLGRTLKLQPHQLLTWARRQTSGDGYRRLVAALDRLSGTRIKTNIKTMDGIEFTNGVGLITEYSARRSSRTGQIIDVQITLSPWLFKMVEGANVLTLHRDYFLLRKPLDRRIYELARKHCGSQAKWSISAEILKKKTGAGGTIRHFREEIRRIVETNHLPDYVVAFADDVVTFFSRAALAAAALPQPKPPLLDASTFEEAKRVAPGYDVYALHEEWIDWWREGGCEPLKDPAKAFVGFCRHRSQRSPLR